MSTWDEVRTAYQVARVGTVSGAAQALGVHHATVIRHIDALEGQLGVKLFQRHARGYTPTEAGHDLLRVAQATDDQFAQLAGRLKGKGEGVGGDLVITSLETLSALLTPVLVGFQQAHPDVTVHALHGERVFRLEYGEAHVAIRAGNAPDDPDNVVQSLGRLDFALYAHESYLQARGRPESDADLANHDFVGPEDLASRAAFFRWLADAVPEARIVLRTPDARVMLDAVRAGAGLGFATSSNAHGLVQVMPPRDEWCVPLWLVTHVDLHRSAKVQSFLRHLKAAAVTWEGVTR
ncbi:LysR family transcriptional regulator [Palleronia sp.]|uniref:LysR family transcriptional regulator n=1 Tax=Palleronia sp. TaxID=1940284 RepID=UPI0035C82988